MPYQFEPGRIYRMPTYFGPVVQALGLGGAEVNPLCFQPFGGLADNSAVVNGCTSAPELPGIGFEGRAVVGDAFRNLLGGN